MVTVTGWGGSSKPYSREFSVNLRRHPHFNFKKVLKFMTRPLSQTFGLHVNKNKSYFPTKKSHPILATNKCLYHLHFQKITMTQKESPTHRVFSHQKSWFWEITTSTFPGVCRASTRSNTMVPALHASSTVRIPTTTKGDELSSFRVVGCGVL